MIIVVTGMVGIDKKQYLQEVCKLARGKGKDVLLCNVGDAMYRSRTMFISNSSRPDRASAWP